MASRLSGIGLLLLAVLSASPGFVVPTSAAADTFTLWTVGDICDDDHAPIPDCADVGDLIDNASPGYFVPLGDNQYENGALANFNTFYQPKVGAKLNDVTRPVVGNHEYTTAGAAGYYAYFGAKAGDPAKGYYSWTHGNWTMVVLNSNCAKIADGCGYTGPQSVWLRAQLAQPATCEIVFDHHPPITDGKYRPGVANTKGFWRRAYEGRAELFLSGHDHGYQRFAPRNTAFAKVGDGVRAVVVGTGGKSFYPFDSTMRSEYRQDTAFGALRLTLTDTAYTGAFVNVDGITMDSFSGVCR
jgi:hypothetical protein